MRIIDEKFVPHALRYVLQCCLATSTILVALLFLDVLEHTALVATLGASAFIVFTMPRAYSSRPRSLIGGYVVAISVGCICHYLSLLPPAMEVLLRRETSLIVFGAFAVGTAMFAMTITNTEHPPAAGMALGLVLNRWDYVTILFVLGAVVFFAVVKRVLRSAMINLAPI